MTDDVQTDSRCPGLAEVVTTAPTTCSCWPWPSESKIRIPPPPPHRRPRAAAARAAADCVAADHTTADRAAATPQPPPLPAPYLSYNQTTRSGPSGHSPGVAREWGSNPHPTTHPPPSTRAHPACRPGLETVGRGEGGRHSSPGAGQRERGPPNSSLGRYTPPTHIGAGRRSYRRTPSKAAALTVLGRAPHAASFIGSRAYGCVMW